MRVRNIDQDPDSLHQRIIADDDLGFTQAIIAQRQGCAQSTVSQVLAAERLRRLRAELGKDSDGSDGSETSVRAVHAAEQVREALAYVRAVEKRLMAVQRLLVADVAADATRERRRVPSPGQIQIRTRQGKRGHVPASSSGTCDAPSASADAPTPPQSA